MLHIFKKWQGITIWIKHLHNKHQLSHLANHRGKQRFLGCARLLDQKQYPKFFWRTYSTQRIKKTHQVVGARKQNQESIQSPSEAQEVFVFPLCLQLFCEAAFMTLPSKFKTHKFIGLAHLITDIYATTVEKQWAFQHKWAILHCL